ncbi:MAG TPA: hypothetical protein VG870_15445 [Chitinophagaceae bacterium]|nr:hypothetical protein [Chitinophagaceae bacterium]
MERFRLSQFITAACLLIACGQTRAQDLTGIWRGYFISDGGEQYKFELQVDQKNNNLSGVSYSYLTTVFYGKALLTGSFNRNAQNALVQEIKTVEVKMGPGSVACIMKCNLQYTKSGHEEFLEGIFTSQFEKNSYGAKKGDNCGSGKVYLRKVPTSDFYVEPFLRDKTEKEPDRLAEKRPDPPKKSPVTTEKPGSRTLPPKTTQSKTQTGLPARKTPQNETAGQPTSRPKAEKVVRDTARADQEPATRIETPHNPGIMREEVPTPYVLRTRENSLVQILNVDVQNVTVRIYDNGEIDDDSISVYLDKKLVLSHQRLTASPLVIRIHLDEETSSHELVMVADNLGRIPPNTSLMIVEAGDKRYEVRITSTEQKNAVVRFQYHKPG